jgi:hypothetical protein
MGSVGSRLARLFAIDLRSLAVFRMALACALFVDLATRVGNLRAHYTEAGIDPVQPLAGLKHLSLHAWLSGSPAAIAALFALAGVVAVALALGWRTRIASVLAWYLLASVQLRNPAVSSMGGDTFLRLLLFWGMFLPLGARFSLDARRRGPAEGPNLLCSAATTALLVQIALMYVTTGFLKRGATWHNGQALWYALQLDYWVTPIGVWMRPYREWLGPMTTASVWFERLGILVAFVPFRNDVFRMLAVVLFVGFHLSIAALIDVGPFPVYCLAGWPAFLPASLWDEWLPRLRGRTPVPRGAEPALATQPLALQAVAALLLAYVLVYVATENQAREMGVIPGPVHRAGAMLRLHQEWSMFSPDPAKIDTWPLAVGVLDDGRQVELARETEFDPGAPERIPARLPGFRWRLFFYDASQSWKDPTKKSDAKRSYAGYTRWLCETWHASDGAGARLARVRVDHAMEHTLPLGPARPVYETVYDRTCPPRPRG